MPDPPAARTLQESLAIGIRARRRIAFRLLPLIFVTYVVNYIDRGQCIARQSSDERRSGLQ